jgi:hypothetical protein
MVKARALNCMRFTTSRHGSVRAPRKAAAAVARRADGAKDNGSKDVVHLNGFVVAEVGIMIGWTTELQTPAGSHAVHAAAIGLYRGKDRGGGRGEEEVVLEYMTQCTTTHTSNEERKYQQPLNATKPMKVHICLPTIR